MPHIDDGVALRAAVVDAWKLERSHAIQILRELRELERDAVADWITVDDHWQSYNVAVRYRELMRDWWQLASAPAMAALYDIDINGCYIGSDDDPGLHFRLRYLTKATDDRRLRLCAGCRSARDSRVPHTCRRVRAKPGERARLRQQLQLPEVPNHGA